MNELTFALLMLALACAAGVLVHFLLHRTAGVIARRAGEQGEALLEASRRPGQLLFVTLAVLVPESALAGLGPWLANAVRHAAAVGALVAVTWLGAALVHAGAALLRARHDITHPDNLEARRVQTQLLVLERTLVAVIVVLGLAAVLMTFPRVREIGASLLVSAGVAGLALGLAARPVLENLIAGLQLAFSQPIRIDDVVIVEGEWGRIEEITMTYVVVAIWDQRRLVVPFSRFISQPFQNWTRRSAEILGTVFIHADYTVPVDAVRAELERVCRACELWDGRVCILQVTDATPRTLEMRALVSASDSARAWDLRVHVREALVGFLQREYPDCLPRARLELSGEPRPDGSPTEPGARERGRRAAATRAGES